MFLENFKGDSRSLKHNILGKMKHNEVLSIKEVYSLIGEMRNELLNEIKLLRTDFLEMEKGRLTKLEQSFAEFKGANNVRVSMTAGIVSVVITLFVVLINKFL